jgi:hypothetical protein
MSFPTLKEIQKSLPTLEAIQKSFSRAIDSNDSKTAYAEMGQKLDRVEIEEACQITDPLHLPQSEEEYYDCAQKLREIGDYPRAREILISLLEHSSNLTMRRVARETLLESIGAGGGWINGFVHCIFLGSHPLRDWSDEAEVGGVRDVIIFSALVAPGGPVLLPALTGPALMITSRFNENAERVESQVTYDRSFDHRR